MSQPIENSNAKDLAIVNVASNLLLIALNMGVSIGIAPYLIHHLGIAAYGMVALANSFPGYIRLFMTAITNSMLRFIAVSVSQHQGDEANQYFNTGFRALLGANAVLLGLVVLFSASFSQVFDVPSGMEQQTNQLVALVLIACQIAALVTMLQVPFTLAHKFYFQNLLMAGSRILGVGVLVGLFVGFGPELVFVGYYQLAVQVVALGLLLHYYAKIQNALYLRRGVFSRTNLNSMSRMGIWVVVNDISILLFLGFGYVVVNKTLGAEATGRLGPVMLINSFIIMLGTAMVKVMVPILYAYVGRGNIHALCERLLQSMRLMGFFVGIPVLMICGLARIVLAVWLGPDFIDLWPLLWLITLSLWFGGTCFAPVQQAFRGMDFVKAPACIELLFSMVHVLLSIYLMTAWGMGLLGFGISFLVTYGVRGAITFSLLARYLLGRPLLHFMAPSLRIGIPLVGLAILGLWASHQVDASLLSLALLSGALVICHVLLGKWTLTERDRAELYQMLGKVFAKVNWSTLQGRIQRK
ncbi:MAG: lipopolysaccharide biosynthesis protein [Pirellulales bacterium]|nr:lipopolysaccharide biosynthesis protein [Pirellulales bacterium]